MYYIKFELQAWLKQDLETFNNRFLILLANLSLKPHKSEGKPKGMNYKREKNFRARYIILNPIFPTFFGKIGRHSVRYTKKNSLFKRNIMYAYHTGKHHDHHLPHRILGCKKCIHNDFYKIQFFCKIYI